MIDKEFEHSEKNISKYQVKIGNIHCSFCASNITKILSSIEGVKDVNVSLAHEEAVIIYENNKVNTSEIDKVLTDLGYTIRDSNKLKRFEEEKAELNSAEKVFLGSAVVTFIQLSLMILAIVGLKQLWFPPIMIALAFINVFGFGHKILKMAYNSIKRKLLNQHVLMEIAAFGGIIGGFWELFINPHSILGPEFFSVATFIVSYHLLGAFASVKVRNNTSRAVEKLLSLQPDNVRVINNDKEIITPITKVKLGDIVLIKPGDSIPLDGDIVSGVSAVNESIVTGEPFPVDKVIGDHVISGSINGYGALKVKVTKTSNESFLNKIASYIEESRALKPSILQLVDIVLKYFVPGVIIAGIIAFIIWVPFSWIILGKPEISTAIFAILSVFVMGYPCALGMSTPLAMMRGGYIAAKNGIIFRSSEAFAEFKKIDTIIYDKTGTVTTGEMVVSNILPSKNYNSNYVLKIAASAESLSEHPIAMTIIREAKSRGIPINTVKDFKTIPGMGVNCLLNGKNLKVGKLDFVLNKPSISTKTKKTLRAMERSGQTVIAISLKNKLIGLIGVTDSIKEDAKYVINEFKKTRVNQILLTGDNKLNASIVASNIGINKVYAGVKPDEKAKIIRNLQRKGHHVLMVGDGINDAPSLMLSNIGVAIKGGTDIAMESADIILLGNRLNSLLNAYKISLKSYSKTKQNILIAFMFNGIGIPVAMSGLLLPIWAMVAMASSFTLVMANSFLGRVIKNLKVNQNKEKIY